MQREVTRTSRQRFGDATKEGEVSRPGKNEPSRQTLGIYTLLDRNEQLRTSLHLVKNSGAFQQ